MTWLWLAAAPFAVWLIWWIRWECDPEWVTLKYRRRFRIRKPGELI